MVFSATATSSTGSVPSGFNERKAHASVGTMIINLTRRRGRLADEKFPSVDDGQPIADGFLIVAQEKEITNQGRRIPRLAIQGFEFGQFVPPGRRRIEQHKFAILRGDEQQVPDKNELAVTITTVLPFQFAGCQLKAGEDAVVQAIHVPIASHWIVELGLEPIRFPKPLSFRPGLRPY